jgi:hypothetical protein
MMNAISKHTSRRAAESLPLLHWIFVRGSKAITFDVRPNHGSYEVCIVPHWDVSQTVVEQYARPADALRRHAEIAGAFRQSGWAVFHGTGRAAA